MFQLPSLDELDNKKPKQEFTQEEQLEDDVVDIDFDDDIEDDIEEDTISSSYVTPREEPYTEDIEDIEEITFDDEEGFVEESPRVVPINPHRYTEVDHVNHGVPQVNHVNHGEPQANPSQPKADMGDLGSARGKKNKSKQKKELDDEFVKNILSFIKKLFTKMATKILVGVILFAIIGVLVLMFLNKGEKEYKITDITGKDISSQSLKLNVTKVSHNSETIITLNLKNLSDTTADFFIESKVDNIVCSSGYEVIQVDESRDIDLKCNNKVSDISKIKPIINENK